MAEKEKIDEMLGKLRNICNKFAEDIRDLANEYNQLFPILMATALEIMTKAQKKMMEELPLSKVIEMLKENKNEDARRDAGSDD